MAVKPTHDSFDRHMLPNRSALVSAGAHTAPVRTNAHPMEMVTDPDSIRTHDRYNWRTGAMETVQPTIMSKAHDHMAKLKVHTITSDRTHPQRDDCYGHLCPTMPVQSAMGVSSTPAPASPLSGGKKSRKRK